MNKLVLIGLIDALISEAISKIPPPETTQGPRGLAGRNGRDFDFEEHRNAISEIVVSNLPSKEELIGPKGSSGKDGKDFDYEEHKVEIQNTIIECLENFKDQLKFTFQELSEDEIESLRGPMGHSGREGRAGADGKGFNFEEHKDSINTELRNFVNSIKDSLKLKLSDLSEDELYLLKGDKGDKGRDGRDFDFEEHEDRIKNLLPGLEELKLKFSDLSLEEVDSLKLKFEDLTDEDISKLPRGARGQRGPRGPVGIQGEDSSKWFTGEGKPTDTLLGKKGDFYLDFSTGDLYQWE